MELMKKDLMMTSLEIAEITGKRHDHVLRDIREEIASLEFEGLEGQLIFGVSSYRNSQNKKQPMYTFGREGAMQIATRYSAPIRRKLIMKLDELENRIKLPTTYKEALLELIKAEEEKEKLQLVIAEQKPLVEFADKMLGSKDSLLIRVYAKLLNEEGLRVGEKRLYSWFRDNGYLNINNEPYQQYMEYFEVKVSTYDTPFGTKTNTTTLIKPKGQLYFFKKLKDSMQK